MSNILENYEVLDILCTNNNSTYYKVKNKTTLKLYVWEAVGCDALMSVNKEHVFQEVNKRKFLEHENLLKFHDYLLEEDTQILYLITEYCTNGSLRNMIEKCLQEGEYIRENFIWYLLYQITNTFKTVTDIRCVPVNIDNVFLDKQFNIKLHYFSLVILEKELHVTSISLAETVLKLCLLQVNHISDYAESLLNLPNYYSKELKSMLKFILNSDTLTFDSILHHPSVLLRKSLPQKLPPYKKIEGVLSQKNIEENINIEDYKSRCENLKNRETALKVKQQEYTNKFNNLQKREQKILQMEQNAKEMMQKAYLYLKRSREKTSCNKCDVSRKANKSSNKENTDYTYATINDSPFQSTSCKINSDGLQVSRLTRRLSQKQVRFKGHSPLKDVNTAFDVPVPVNTEKKKVKKRSSLFSILHKDSKSSATSIEYEQDCSSFKRISWDDVTKKQAFDLLRIMNEKCNNSVNVKHTDL